MHKKSRAHCLFQRDSRKLAPGANPGIASPAMRPGGCAGNGRLSIHALNAQRLRRGAQQRSPQGSAANRTLSGLYPSAAVGIPAFCRVWLPHLLPPAPMFSRPGYPTTRCRTNHTHMLRKLREHHIANTSRLQMSYLFQLRPKFFANILPSPESAPSMSSARQSPIFQEGRRQVYHVLDGPQSDLNRASARHAFLSMSESNCQNFIVLQAAFLL
jgi:hypothetical protein